MLSAPTSAGASTLEVFTVSGTYTYNFGANTGTLSGTFDYDGTLFSNFSITATGWLGGPTQSDLFNVDSFSTSTLINVLSSADSMASLTLLPAVSLATINPGGSTTFTGNSICMSGGGCPEFPVGTLTASAASAVPLPASLPLFAGGLGAMALLRRLRKRAA
jgi:hypothetical protein